MSRPKPRKTSLARLSPTDPPAQAPPVPSQQTGSGSATAASPPPATASAVAEPVGERRTYRHKVSFYQERDDTARVRAAIMHTNHLEGPRSLSDFVHHAVMTEVERLERKYNDGEPWPGIGPGELPRGRPMGS